MPLQPTSENPPLQAGAIKQDARDTQSRDLHVQDQGRPSDMMDADADSAGRDRLRSSRSAIDNGSEERGQWAAGRRVRFSRFFISLVYP